MLNLLRCSEAFIRLLLVFDCFAVIVTANHTLAGTSHKSEVQPCEDTYPVADVCFKELPPHLMEFLQSPKVVINEQEIIAKCTVFHRGMECFDAYTARCLNEQNKHLYENNVEGARNFFRKFCSDREFQKAYLQHKDCFGYIHDDWEMCTKSFQKILTDELANVDANITDKYMQFCCARHAYENCLYRSARFKCYRNSVEFARYTAKILSDEKHFTNCRNYENIVCASAAWMGPTIWPSFMVLIIWIPVRLVCDK